MLGSRTRSAEDRLRRINDNTNSSLQPVLCRVWFSPKPHKTMKINEPCSEDYQCGWNRGVADFQKNITSTITASEGRTGRAYAEFIEGYLASQENLLIQRADLRESGVLVIG